MQKTPFVFPLVGGRKVEHLYDNITALDITLSPQQIDYIESVTPFDVGFPARQGVGKTLMPLMSAAAVVDKQPPVPPLRPSEAMAGAKN